MKIAFIVGDFPVLSETFVLNQVTGLLDLGHDVRIFTKSKSKDATPDIEAIGKYDLMARVHRPRLEKRGKAIRSWWFLATLVTSLLRKPARTLHAVGAILSHWQVRSLRWLDILLTFPEQRFDIVHCHFGPNGNIGVCLKRIDPRVKVVTVFHGFDLSVRLGRDGTGIYRRLFARGDLFLPVSEYWKAKLMELGCDPAKILVHHMGVDPAQFEFQTKRIAGGQRTRILTVGRLVEKKGHQFALCALGTIAAKNKDFVLTIVGDGPLLAELESLVNELGLKSQVRFVGAVDHVAVARLYHESHIFLLPSITAANSDQEGIPVVLMEAQACGLPVVSTYHSGISEVVIDGESGYLVAEKDVAALAEKLDYLIEHPEVWPQMGQRGRAHIEESFNIDRLNRYLVKAYDNLMRKRGATDETQT